MEAACQLSGPRGRALSQTIRVQPSRVQRIHGRRNAARRTRRRFFAELPFLLVAALILTVLVKGFLIQAFFIPSRSMEPTLDVGDRVVVNRLAYRLGDPAPGQVVVFLRPTGADQPRRAAPSPGSGGRSPRGSGAPRRAART